MNRIISRAFRKRDIIENSDKMVRFWKIKWDLLKLKQSVKIFIKEKKIFERKKMINQIEKAFSE